MLIIPCRDMCLLTREHSVSTIRTWLPDGSPTPTPPFLYVDTLPPDAMAKGTVDFFNDSGGYGFIETEDADEDVFFHMEDVGGPDLEEGQEVEFDIVEAEKGPRAENLKRL